MTPNECRGAAYLNAAGYSQEAIGEFLDFEYETVGIHIRGECGCPDLDEPQPIPDIDGDELRAARMEARLTQEELGDVVDASNVTISQIERGTVEGSPAMRWRLNEWLSNQKE